MNLIFENIVSFFIGVIFGIILTFLRKRLVGTNQDFFKTIEDFRRKLPPSNKKAKISEVYNMSHMNLNTLSHNIESKDIDMFLKELEELDLDNLIIRKKEIIEFSNNLQRIIKTTSWNDFLVAILSEMLDENKLAERKLFFISLKFYKYSKF